MSLVAKKKEGWPGVILTALLCGVFLWFWFKPEPVDPALERTPGYWLELASRKLKSRTLAEAVDVLPVWLALEKRDAAAAQAVANDWLGPLGPLAAADSPLAPSPPADDPALAGVAAALEKARAAIDGLDLEQGRAVLQEAAAAATDPVARSWVATRQVRSGFASDAKIDPSEVEKPPRWLVAEWILADRFAPAVEWLATHGDDAELKALFVATTRDRFEHRDSGPVASQGAAADPLRPDERRERIYRAVEANQLTAARNLASDDPALWLVIARALAWLSVPEPAPQP